MERDIRCEFRKGGDAMTTTAARLPMKDDKPVPQPVIPVRTALAAVPAIGLAVTVVLTSGVRPWVRMWTFAFAVYFGCKAWVLMNAWWKGQRFTFRALVQFVFCWAGMGPTPFATEVRQVADDRLANVPRAAVLEGVWKLLAGFLLFASASMLQRHFGDLVAVWACISAYCLVLHFGILHLFAAYWLVALS